MKWAIVTCLSETTALNEQIDSTLGNFMMAFVASLGVSKLCSRKALGVSGVFLARKEMKAIR
jgi:hypothetical protein